MTNDYFIVATAKLDMVASEELIREQLKKLGEKLQLKITAEGDFSKVNQKIKTDMSKIGKKAAEKLNQQFKNTTVNAPNIKFNKVGYKDLEKYLAKVRKEVDQFAKLSIKTDNLGQINSATLEYVNQQGQAVRQNLGYIRDSVDKTKLTWGKLGETIVSNFQRGKQSIEASRASLDKFANRAKNIKFKVESPVGGISKDDAGFKGLQQQYNKINSYIGSMTAQLNRGTPILAEQKRKLDAMINSYDIQVKKIKATKDAEQSANVEKVKTINILNNIQQKLNQQLQSYKMGKNALTGNNLKNIEALHVSITKQIEKQNANLQMGKTLNAQTLYDLKASAKELQIQATQYKNIEAIERGRNKAIEKSLNSLSRMSSQLKKIQAGFDPTKSATGIKDTGQLQSLQAEYDKIKLKIDSLVNARKIASEAEKRQIQQSIDALKLKTAALKNAQQTEAKNAGYAEGKLVSQTEGYNKIIRASDAYNTSLLRGHKIIQKSVKETENYIAVTQRLQRGTNIEDLTVNIARNADGTLGKMYEVRRATTDLTHDVITWDQAIVTAIKRMFQWMVAGTLIFGAFGQIKEAISSVIDMDTALTDLNKVTDLTIQQLDQMKMSAIEIGKAFGQSAVEIAKGMAEWGRFTKDTEEIINLTKVATLASNVSDLSVAEAAKTLTTAMLQFKIETKDAITIIDEFNEIQNNFKTTAGDLAQGIAQVGSVAEQTGVSIQQLEGYITAVTSATGKTGAEIGTTLKSVISRTFRVGSEGFADAGKAEDALNNLGINIRKQSGDFKSFNTILTDLSQKWENMSKVQKLATAQSLAGTHQYSKFMALMENFDIAIAATNKAFNSQNSAMNENEKYVNSAEGRLNTMKATLEELYETFISSDSIKDFISFITNLISTVDGLVEKFGGLNVAIVAIGGALLTLTTQGRQLSASLSGSIPVLNVLSKQLNKLTEYVTFNRDIMRENVIETRNSIATNRQAGRATGQLTRQLLAQRGQLLLLNAATITATALTIAFQAALTLGLSVAITTIISGITSLINKRKEEAEQLAENTQKTYERIKTLEDEVKAIKTLASEYESLKEKTDKNSNDLNRMLEIEKALVEQYGVAANGINAQGEAYTNNIDLINLRIKAIQEEIKVEKDLLKTKALASENERNTTLDKEKKEIEEKTALINNVKKQIQSDIDYLNQPLAENVFMSPAEINKVKARINNYYKTLEEAQQDLLESQGKIQEATKASRTVLNNEAQNYVKSLENNGVQFNAANKQFINLLSENLSYTGGSLEDQVKILKTEIDKIAGLGLEKAIESYEEAKKIAEIKPSEANKQALDDAGKGILNVVQKIEKDFVPATEEQRKAFELLKVSILETYGIMEKKIPKGVPEGVKFQAQQQPTVKIDQVLKKDEGDYFTSITESVEGYNAKINEANQAFKKHLDAARDLQDALKELSDTHELSGASLEKILTAYPVLAKYMGDEVELSKQIQIILNDEIDAHKERFRTKLELDEQYYDVTFKNNDKFWTEIQKAYGIDAKNFETYSDMKNSTNNLLIKTMGKSWQEYYNELGRSQIDQLRTAILAQEQTLSALASGGAYGSAQFEATLSTLKQLRAQMAVLQKSKVTIDLDLDKVNFDKLDESTKKVKDKVNSSLEFNQKYLIDYGAEVEALISKLNILRSEYTLLEKTNASFAEKQKKLNEILATQVLKQEAISRMIDKMTSKKKSIELTMKIDPNKSQDAIDAAFKNLSKKSQKKFNEQYQDWKELDKAIKTARENVVTESEAILSTQAEQIGLYFDESTKKIEKFDKEIENINNKLALLDTNDAASQFDLLNTKASKSTEKLNLLITETRALEVRLSKVPKLTKEFANEMNNLEESISGTRTEIKAIYEEMYNLQVSAISNVESKIVEILKSNYAEKERLEKESTQNKIDNYKKDLEEFKKVQEAKLKALEDTFKQEDYAEQLREHTEKELELRKKLNEARLDDSLDNRKNIADLEKQLADVQKETADFVRDHDREIQKEAIQEKIKNEEKLAKEKEDIANDSFDAFEKDLEQRLKNENIYLEARKALSDGVLKDIDGNIISLTEAYKIFEDTFGKGISTLGKTIKDDFISQINLATKSIQTLNTATGKLSIENKLESAQGTGVKNYLSSQGFTNIQSSGKLITAQKNGQNIALSTTGFETIDNEAYATKGEIEKGIQYGVATALQQKGYQNIAYDGSNITATLNDKKYLISPSNFKNIQGHFYGTQEEIQQSINDQLVNVRSFLENANYTVGWDAQASSAIASKDGVNYFLESDKFKNINGSLYGLESDIYSNLKTGVRTFLENMGYELGWNDKSKQVTVSKNGTTKALDTNKFENIGGSFVGSIADIKDALSQIGFYKYGGIVDQTQLAMLHGTSGDFEAVLRERQLTDLMNEVVNKSIGEIIPNFDMNGLKIPSQPVNNSVALNINNLINIEGNIDNNNVNKVKEAGDNVLDKLTTSIKQVGFSKKIQ